MGRRIAARGIILHEDKLLCVRLTDYRSIKKVKFWCVPGGGISEGESITAALNREIIEELGIKPKIGKLLFVQQFDDNGTEQMEFFFHITNGEDFTSIDLTKTSHGVEEIQELAFHDPKAINLLPKFLSTEIINPTQAEVKFYSEL